MSSDDVPMVDGEEVQQQHMEDGSQPVDLGPRNVPNEIIIYFMGMDSKTVDLTNPHMRTFEDIHTALEAQGVQMDGKVLVDDQDNVKPVKLPLHNNVPLAGLAVKSQIPMYVTHDAMEWTVPILLNSKMTMRTVKDSLIEQNEASFRNVELTWKGVVPSDDTRTDALEEIHSLSNTTAENIDELRQRLRFIGRKTISVMDIDVGESSSVELTDVQDFMSIDQVVQMYKERARRFHLEEALFTKYIDGETNPDSMLIQPNMNGTSTVYQEQLDHGDTIALKTAMFEIVLKEQSEIDAALARNKGVGSSHQRSAADDVLGIRVNVFDWWKVHQVKDAYSALVTEGLGANDQLYLDSATGSVAFNDELNENKTLYQYTIKPNSVLLVKREDFATTYCYYICADCGSDVKLKQRDAVRCRECGHRIVFKRRIAKPCQYLCR